MPDAVRSAVRDGNEGYVSAPSIRHTSSTQSHVTKQVDPDVMNIQKVSQGLGNAFTEYVQEEVANLKEQQKLSGVAKAGMQKSMAEVDVDVKQTGFTDFIFGEDIEYRAAQQQVITNGVEAQYRKELANIDLYQGYTEREYGQVVRDALDVIADQHKDDPETKALATNAWITASGKLVDKHHKTHFAYKQTQMRKIEHDTTMGRIDQMAIEEGEVTSPEDVRQYNKAWDNIFDAGVRPAGMTEVAKSSQNLEIVNETLAAGNITPYKQGLLRDVWKGATPKQAADRDKAIGKYDTKFNLQVNTTLEQTAASIENIADNDQAEALIEVLDTSIDQHETRSSGSAKGANTIAEARSRAERMRSEIRKRGAAATKKGKDIALARSILKIDNPVNREATKNAAQLTKKVWDAAQNEGFTEHVSAIVGEEVDAQTAVNKLLSDPNFGKMYEAQFESGRDIIPSLAAGMKGGIQGASAMADPETGFATEQWRGLMTTLSGYDRVNSPRLAEMLGKDDYRRFQMYKAASFANIPMAQMEDRANEVLEGAANKADYANSINLPEGTSKRDYVQGIFSTQGYPIQDQTKLMGWFDEGMNFSKGDPKVAKDYVNAMYKQNEIRSGGLTIANAKQLSAYIQVYDDTGENMYTVDKVLDFLQTDDYGKNFLQPFAGAWDDRPNAENARQFWQVPGIKVEADIDNNGLWITSPAGKSRLISNQQLTQAAQVMKRQNKQQAVEEERLAEVNRKAKVSNSLSAL